MNHYIPVNLRCEYENRPIGVQKSQPLLGWQVRAEERDAYQSAYQIAVSSSLKRLEEEVYDMWDTGKVMSGRCYSILYEGVPLVSARRVYWKVRIWDQNGEASEYSSPEWFEMGLLKEEDWKGKWMGFLGGLIGNGILMRYSFKSQDKKIERARAYICCAGYYELRMNGSRIGDKLLDPAPSDYSRTLLYSAYDVTENMREGANVIGLVLGTGWAGQPRVLVQLNIEYEDGSRQEEFTDWGIGWCVAKGPVVYNSIYDGEDYDARLEKDGWDTPEYEPRFLKEHQRPNGWILATVVEDPQGKKTGELLPPVRVVRKTKPEHIRTFEDGRMLYDTGENQSGWVRLTAEGETGSKVTLSFAEVLDADGDLDKRALRLARCEDSYILRGNGKKEEYAPRFTYHGFRYFTVKIEGRAVISDLTAEHIRSSVRPNAVFNSDDEFLNRLAAIMRHTDGCNLMGIPTDCDQRDERHGWTTDTTSRAEGCTCHFDMGSFFEKWARDVYDTQDEKGYFADTAPFRWGRRPCDPQVNTPVSLVLLMYEVYGDRRIVEECYDSMMKYLRVLLKEADDYLISRTGFGEWACPREECVREEYGAGAASKNVTPTLVSTAYLYYSISQIKKMAEILKKDDIQYLEGLQRTVCQKYNERFFNKESFQYDMGSQSANALSLALGLVPDAYKKAVADNIAADIRKHSGHMTTGNMGTKALLEVLCQAGMDDEAYEVMTVRTAPGFGYMLEKGATSVWERWEADEDNNIMNSRNQPMLAAACVWFYKYLGGIKLQTDEDGLQQPLIEPSVPEKLNQVHVSMEILNGTVTSSWKKEKEKFILEVTVPFNTRAQINVPKKCGSVTHVLYNGAETSLRKAGEDERSFNYETGSGKYTFLCAGHPSEGA